MSIGTVPADYRMDPVEDVLLWDGTGLRVGMIVLLADAQYRRNSPEMNRPAWDWALVERCERDTLFVTLLLSYSDGSREKCTYLLGNPWLARKVSIPSGGPS